MRRSSSSPPLEQEIEIDLSRYAAIVSRRRRIVLAVSVLAAVFAAEARLAGYPISSHEDLALAFGMIGGILLGVLVALMIEALDQTVRTRDDVERRVELTFLGLIPYARGKKGAPVYAALLSSDVSSTSEAFRDLRTIVGRATVSEGAPFILVTSTIQDEGKSFVATNLAVAFAQLGQRVLIVDGDLRRPRLHRNLQASNEKGVGHFLSGGAADPGDIVQATGIPNLDVAACGPRPPNPAELLKTERLARLIAWARGRYARVIVDCPPVFPTGDVLLWSDHIKPVLFVARSGSARAPLMRTACARLRTKGARIVGGVINGASH